MYFSNIAATGLLALTSVVTASPIEKRALTAQRLVAHLNQLTTQTEALTRVVYAVQPGPNLNSPTENPFEDVIQGYHGLSQTADSYTEAMSEGTQYNNADAQKICTAYHNFVVLHQDTLAITTGKSGFLDSEAIFAGPMAAVLRNWEGSVDNFSFGIIDSSRFCEAKATKDKQYLDRALEQAVCAYTPLGTVGGGFC